MSPNSNRQFEQRPGKKVEISTPKSREIFGSPYESSAEGIPKEVLDLLGLSPSATPSQVEEALKRATEEKKVTLETKVNSPD